MAEQEKGIKKIPLHSILLRSMASATYGRMIPYRVFEIELPRKTESGMESAIKHAAEGYGTIIAFTHPSKGEPPRIANMVFKTEVLRERHIAIPVALHQVRTLQSRVADLLCTPNIPIITDSTETVFGSNSNETSKKQAAQLMRSYFDRTLAILSEGGVALISPQGTRQPKLEKVTSAISTLVNRAKKSGIGRIGILFIGVEIPEQGMKTTDGINYGLVYKLNIGRYFTVEQLLEEAGGKLSNLDSRTRRELSYLVAQDYLPID